VYRLSALTQDAWTVEAVRVPKVAFDDWLEQATRSAP